MVNDKREQTISNKEVYEAEDVVSSYTTESSLSEPEKTVLNIFKDRLKNMRMLDIGIGGGRTTCNFAHIAKEYVGIDYSGNMINACKKRFPTPPESISFRVCDVRSMRIFEDNYFDFVLFSYNGIDVISHMDRLKALQEIERVCRIGGYFCFSSHNLQGIDQLFTPQLSANPIRTLKKIAKYFLLRPTIKKLKQSRYAMIRDGAHNHRLVHYYIKPKEQIEQLSSAGFRNVRVYSLDGKEIEDKSRLGTITDTLWLYYLCEA
ncbi:MAG: class I SAM-dependent methyltransferase [Candidatus Methanoperedens sp.]|nr:class I SAM-dependent methyltransferase [Candidatus Methanoperedens sp.]